MTNIFYKNERQISDFLYHNERNNYNFNFLDYYKKTTKLNTDIYYDLVRTIELFKLKSIIHFNFIKFKKMDIDFDVNINFKEKMNVKQFNSIIKQIINNDLFKSVLIINLISRYFI